MFGKQFFCGHRLLKIIQLKVLRMEQTIELQHSDEFEFDAPALSEFAHTTLNATEEGTRLAGTGFATCPAKTGKYC